MQTLAGRLILVLEDEYFLGQDVAEALRDLGAEVVGPYATAQSALDGLGGRRVDGAVVDMNLRGDTSARVADHLKQEAVPMLIVSGYGRDALPERFRETPYLEKPVEARAVGRRVCELVGG